MKHGYMGVFVEDVEDMTRSCSTCEYEREVDRAACNSCARSWLASQMTRYPGWKLKLKLCKLETETA